MNFKQNNNFMKTIKKAFYSDCFTEGQLAQLVRAWC